MAAFSVIIAGLKQGAETTAPARLAGVLRVKEVVAEKILARAPVILFDGVTREEVEAAARQIADLSASGVEIRVTDAPDGLLQRVTWPPSITFRSVFAAPGNGAPAAPPATAPAVAHRESPSAGDLSALTEAAGEIADSRIQRGPGPALAPRAATTAPKPRSAPAMPPAAPPPPSPVRNDSILVPTAPSNPVEALKRTVASKTCLCVCPTCGESVQIVVPKGMERKLRIPAAARPGAAEGRKSAVLGRDSSSICPACADRFLVVFPDEMVKKGASGVVSKSELRGEEPEADGLVAIEEVPVEDYLAAPDPPGAASLTEAGEVDEEALGKVSLDSGDFRAITGERSYGAIDSFDQLEAEVIRTNDSGVQVTISQRDESPESAEDILTAAEEAADLAQELSRDGAEQDAMLASLAAADSAAEEAILAAESIPPAPPPAPEPPPAGAPEPPPLPGASPARERVFAATTSDVEYADDLPAAPPPPPPAPKRLEAPAATVAGREAARAAEDRASISARSVESAPAEETAPAKRRKLSVPVNIDLKADDRRDVGPRSAAQPAGRAGQPAPAFDDEVRAIDLDADLAGAAEPPPAPTAEPGAFDDEVRAVDLAADLEESPEATPPAPLPARPPPPPAPAAPRPPRVPTPLVASGAGGRAAAEESAVKSFEAMGLDEYDAVNAAEFDKAAELAPWTGPARRYAEPRASREARKARTPLLNIPDGEEVEFVSEGAALRPKAVPRPPKPVDDDTLEPWTGSARAYRDPNTAGRQDTAAAAAAQEGRKQAEEEAQAAMRARARAEQEAATRARAAEAEAEAEAAAAAARVKAEAAARAKAREEAAARAAAEAEAQAQARAAQERAGRGKAGPKPPAEREARGALDASSLEVAEGKPVKVDEFDDLEGIGDLDDLGDLGDLGDLDQLKEEVTAKSGVFAQPKKKGPGKRGAPARKKAPADAGAAKPGGAPAAPAETAPATAGGRSKTGATASPRAARDAKQPAKISARKVEAKQGDVPHPGKTKPKSDSLVEPDLGLDDDLLEGSAAGAGSGAGGAKDSGEWRPPSTPSSRKPAGAGASKRTGPLTAEDLLSMDDLDEVSLSPAELDSDNFGSDLDADVESIDLSGDSDRAKTKDEPPPPPAEAPPPEEAQAEAPPPAPESEQPEPIPEPPGVTGPVVNLYLSKITDPALRPAAVKILMEEAGWDRAKAESMVNRSVIPVLKNVAEERAEICLTKLREANLSARITKVSK
ncbi:MAG: hypothetical protein HY719_00175 [Planctomycetes bacterium]|nr:hypothetical protein [Planctomycetota bacterium]